MKLKIQGTIVSADYDDSYFADWIDRGVITPSSRVVAALEDLPDGEAVDLYVNSYGGDVFAGGEMLIALEKAHAAGRLASVEVGAIAASMAANIVAALKARGAKVCVHANSTLMFHGCYTLTEGGAQHHEDVAGSLRNINNAVIADLNRIGITDCRAWFAEGRERWIDANEAVSLKLADTISIGVGDAPAEAKKTASRLAAFAAKVTNKTEYQMELDNEIKAGKSAKTAPEAAETREDAPVIAHGGADDKSTAPDAGGAETPSDADSAPRSVPLAEVEKRIAGLQAAKDKEIAALRVEIETLKTDNGAKDATLAEANATVEQLRTENAEAKAALVEAQAALNAEIERHRARVGAALHPQPEMPTLAEALAKCATPAEKSALIASGKYRK